MTIDRPGGSQALGDAEADAASGACDDGDASLKFAQFRLQFESRLSLQRARSQSADEEALEQDVQDQHRQARHYHARHSQRHLMIITPLKHADTHHKRAHIVILQEQ